MSREHLQALIADTDRLLVAGGSVAAGDEGLRRREKTLRDLGAKVPVLAQVADTTNRVLSAAPKQAPAALLDLLLVAQQLRFSLATVGADGPLTSAEPSGPWATNAPARDVYALKEALDQPASHRLDVLKDAIQRQVVTDLRLIGSLTNHLDDGYGELADLVAGAALPAFGKAVLPELRRQIDLKGSRADARRLMAVCKIDAAVGIELCHAALREGNATLRVQALKCLAEADPAAAERAALELLVQGQPHASAEGDDEDRPPALGLVTPKGNRELRAAVLAALASSRNHDALAALLAAATDHEEVWIAAAAALRTLPYPKLTKRLIEELQMAVANVDALRTATGEAATGKAKPKGRVKPSRVTNETLDWATARVTRLLRVLGQRGDAQAVPAMAAVLKHPLTDLREAAVHALTELNDPAGLEAAADLMNDPPVRDAALDAAWKLPARARYDRLAPFCENLSHAKERQRETGESILELFEQEACSDKPRTDWDPRWSKLLLKLLDGPNRPGVAIALEVVLRQKAIPELLRRLAPSVKKNECGVVEALGRLRAREAVAPMIELMPGQQAYHFCIHDALRTINDPAAIPALKELLDRTRDRARKHAIEAVIDDLEKHEEA
jgi:HEAT repeat protein